MWQLSRYTDVIHGVEGRKFETIVICTCEGCDDVFLCLVRCLFSNFYRLVVAVVVVVVLIRALLLFGKHFCTEKLS